MCSIDEHAKECAAKDAARTMRIRRTRESPWVNSDLLKMADDFRKQARSIQDDDAWAQQKRAHLHRAAGHLLQAFAELDEIPYAR